MTDPQFGIPNVDPVPLPAPEHQKKITRQKWFEIVTVILLIIGGMTFLSWRNDHTHISSNPSQSLAESVQAIESLGGVEDGTRTIMNRQFQSFRLPLDIFVCHVDLVGIESGSPLETAVVWLTPTPGQWESSPESLQLAVNKVSQLGQLLVPTSGEALGKATNTLSFIGDSVRPHDKGVAGTSDGWKLTYVAYRSFDEEAEPQPALFLVLQRLSAGSDTALADFNRTLYDAIERGVDVKTALGAAEADPAIG